MCVQIKLLQTYLNIQLDVFERGCLSECVCVYVCVCEYTSKLNSYKGFQFRNFRKSAVTNIHFGEKLSVFFKDIFFLLLISAQNNKRGKTKPFFLFPISLYLFIHRFPSFLFCFCFVFIILSVYYASSSDIPFFFISLYPYRQK